MYFSRRTHRVLVIRPRFTLPLRSRIRPGRQRWTRQLRYGAHQIAALLIAANLAYLAYRYLAPWPVYRVVAFVMLVILYANFSTARKHPKTPAREPATTVSFEQALTDDTTTYLRAIKLRVVPTLRTAVWPAILVERDEDETVKIRRVQRPVSVHYRDRGLQRLRDASPI